jgi:hypothetical protein
MFDNRMTKAEIIEAATYQARCHMNACIEIDRLRAENEALRKRVEAAEKSGAPHE